MLLTTIALGSAVGTFVFLCALELGFSAVEKFGLGGWVFGMLVGAIAAFQLSSFPDAMSGLSDLEPATQAVRRWIYRLYGALGLVCMGSVLFFGSAVLRSWHHRRSLFPFCYGSREKA